MKPPPTEKARSVAHILGTASRRTKRKFAVHVYYAHNFCEPCGFSAKNTRPQRALDHLTRADYITSMDGFIWYSTIGLSDIQKYNLPVEG